MPAIKYKVELTPSERSGLIEVSRRGKPLARTVKRTLALLKADEGLSDREVAEAVSVSAATVARARRRFVEEGLEAAINDRPRPGRGRKLSGLQEAHLVAITCSDAPEGHTNWTLQLLADKVVAMEFAGSISLEDGAPDTQKNELKTMEEERVVHPQGERGVRGPDGGCAGPVPRRLRPRASPGVFRRDLQAVGRGGEAAHQSQAGTGGTLRLRVPTKTVPETGSCSVNLRADGDTSK